MLVRERKENKRLACGEWATLEAHRDMAERAVVTKQATRLRVQKPYGIRLYGHA